MVIDKCVLSFSHVIKIKDIILSLILSKGEFYVYYRNDCSGDSTFYLI